MTDLYQIALNTLKTGAPGLSDQTKEVLAGIIARKAALRNRTSEPEAGAVETLGPSAGFWSNVITHPAPATADKLRVAKEALEKAYRAWFVEGGESVDVLECVGPILAALNEGGA